MIYDAIVVGAGIAGLTSAAYLARNGCKVLLCEKSNKTGGLVSSFQYNGFVLDGGIRAIENSGIVWPMFRQLEIDLDIVKNPVTIGIGDRLVKLETEESLAAYRDLLVYHFPDNSTDIDQIIHEISRVSRIMDILYGIDNPLFRDLKADRYLFHTLLPWLLRYQTNIGKALKLQEPIEAYLRRFTANESLIDMICQHFFRDTPAFFALSYFRLYLEYSYPLGGTAAIVHKLEEYIHANNGEIRLETEVVLVDPSEHTIWTSRQEEMQYRKLIWAGDLRRFYQSVKVTDRTEPGIRQKTLERQALLQDKTGGDSIYTVFITLDLDQEYFRQKCGPHAFYTPSILGLHHLSQQDLQSPADSETSRFIRDKQAILVWLKRYFELTTYEISCPVLRDDQLAPAGQTGLIVSTLMDYSLVRHIDEMGWYAEFKEMSELWVIDVLEHSLFPGFSDKILDHFSSTPLTIERQTSSWQGAITGWAFTNRPFPAENRFKKITRSIYTPLPDVYQAGQWTFSPSGLPISILTGKLAADEVIRQIKAQ